MDIKKTNLLDILLLITIIFSISGFILAKAEKTSLNKVIKGKEEIGIEVLIPDVFSPDDEKAHKLFKVGEKASITIRNRPYTKLTIIKAEPKPKYIIIQEPSGAYKTVFDPSRSNIKDFFVTVTDNALKTKDGYVVGGNKIKIGNPIELEGFDYRLRGKVVNIYPLPKPKVEEAKVEEEEFFEEPIPPVEFIDDTVYGEEYEEEFEETEISEANEAVEPSNNDNIAEPTAENEPAVTATPLPAQSPQESQ